MGQISESHRAALGDVYINVVVVMRARVLLVSLGCEVGSYNHGGVLRCLKNIVTNLPVRKAPSKSKAPEGTLCRRSHLGRRCHGSRGKRKAA